MGLPHLGIIVIRGNFVEVCVMLKLHITLVLHFCLQSLQSSHLLLGHEESV